MSVWVKAHWKCDRCSFIFIGDTDRSNKYEPKAPEGWTEIADPIGRVGHLCSKCSEEYSIWWELGKPPATPNFTPHWAAGDGDE